MSKHEEEKLYHLSTAELKDIYEFTIALAHQAGDILLEGVDKRCGSEAGRDQGQVDKDSSVDIVTETDLAVEAFVKQKITERYPEHEYDITLFVV